MRSSNFSRSVGSFYALCFRPAFLGAIIPLVFFLRLRFSRIFYWFLLLSRRLRVSFPLRSIRKMLITYLWHAYCPSTLGRGGPGAPCPCVRWALPNIALGVCGGCANILGFTAFEGLRAPPLCPPGACPGFFGGPA